MMFPLSTKFLKFNWTFQNQVRLLFVRNLHDKKPVPVAWEKPREGWTKLNYDGSCKGKTGKSSIGGVFRDHNAEFLLGYAESIGRSSSTMAELVALRRGLELTLEHGWTSVWLEGDAKLLVDILVKKRSVRSSEAQNHVDHIKNFMLELDDCMVTHIYREGNRVADKFAQIGHHLDKPKIWRHAPPNEILGVFHDDAKGKIILRRRR
ncbi:hypothetical protein Droror1_Dr00010478 [Drosera rotundifolia]